MDYYKHQSRFTEITTQSWIVDQLKPDIQFLMQCVKSILIHPIDATREKVKYDRSRNGLFHAQTATVDSILLFPGLKPYLEERELPLNTLPKDRAVLSCDHHALLFASFLRYVNIPVRLKTGFAKYLVTGIFVPHWIVEIYDENSNCWHLVDPDKCIENVKPDEFMSIEDSWEYFKESNENDIPRYSGLKGRQGLKYGLISQLNCIFKNEMLSYEWRLKTYGKEKPELMKKTYDKLDPEQKKDVNDISSLLHSPDANIKKLWDIYYKNRLSDGIEIPHII